MNCSLCSTPSDFPLCYPVLKPKATQRPAFRSGLSVDQCCDPFAEQSMLCRRTTSLCLRSVVRPTLTSGTRSQAQFPITFPRRAVEFGKTIFGNWSTDSIIYAAARPPVNVVTGLNPSPQGSTWDGSYRRTASQSWFPEYRSRSGRSRQKGNQSSRIHETSTAEQGATGDEMPCVNSALRKST